MNQTTLNNIIVEELTKAMREAKYPTAYEYSVYYDLRTDPEAPMQSLNVHNQQLGHKRFVQSDTQKAKDMQVILNTELNQFKADFAKALETKSYVSVRPSGSMGGGRDHPKSIRADAVQTIRFKVTKISSRGEHIPISMITWSRDTNAWTAQVY